MSEIQDHSFRFPKPERARPGAKTPRPLTIADLHSMWAWVSPLILAIHPAASLPGVRHLLNSLTSNAADRAGMRVWRTERALGLYAAVADVLEPRRQVETKFVVHQAGAEDEAEAIRAAALRWARSMGAISFDGAPMPAEDAAAA